MVTIGVLALQGDVAEHVRALEKSGARTLLVRRDSELARVDGLVIPGGESTTMSQLLTSFGLFDPLGARIASGMPVYGTCAGMIVLASSVLDVATISAVSARSTWSCGATPSAARSTPTRRTWKCVGLGVPPSALFSFAPRGWSLWERGSR